MVPADSDRVSRAPPYSGSRPVARRFRVRGSHPLRPAVPGRSASPLATPWRPYYPAAAETAAVWALPLSLATTRGITVVFSSSGYLDVSVPRVCPPVARGGTPPAYRVAPFGHPRISGHLRLPAAFRSLSRPSSPPEAQASPVRPCSLPRRVARLPPAPAPVSYPVLSLRYFSLATTSKNPSLPVENIGVEPMTPCLQGRCSGQLS